MTQIVSLCELDDLDESDDSEVLLNDSDSFLAYNSSASFKILSDDSGDSESSDFSDYSDSDS